MSTTGWGRGGYGLGAYGTGTFEDVSLTDVSATGEVGTVAVTGTAQVSLTSDAVMTVLGTIDIYISVTAYLTGLAATANQGNILVWGEAPVPAPGSWVPVSGAPSGGWGPITPPTTDWVPVAT